VHATPERQGSYLAEVRTMAEVSGLAGTRLGSADMRRLLEALTGEEGLRVGILDLSDVTVEGMLPLTQGSIDMLLLNQTLIEGDLQLEDLDVGELQAMGLRVTGDLAVGSVLVGGHAVLSDLTVEGDFTGRDNACAEELYLVRCRIKGATRLHVAAPRLNLQSARLEGGGDIRFHGDMCSLRFADISGPTLLSSGRAFTQDIPGSNEDAPSPVLPRLASLESANVDGLTVAGLDLRFCRFSGAHNLDRLRIEDSCVLHYAPQGWSLTRLAIPVRHSRRRVVMEEITYRATARGERAWAELLGQQDIDSTISDIKSPVDIASIYRSLRKGREDARDEPGAADFYYGEMEMRRQRVSAGPLKNRSGIAERTVIDAYWAVSGYSLRAWRAFSLLALLVLASATMIALCWPTYPRVSASAGERYLNGIWIAVGSICLRSIPQGSPSGLARLLLCLAVVGPILLGMGLLAIRGRVKR
jgi:hypothetical protein